MYQQDALSGRLIAMKHEVVANGHKSRLIQELSTLATQVLVNNKGTEVTDEHYICLPTPLLNTLTLVEVMLSRSFQFLFI